MRLQKDDLFGTVRFVFLMQQCARNTCTGFTFRVRRCSRLNAQRRRSKGRATDSRLLTTGTADGARGALVRSDKYSGHSGASSAATVIPFSVESYRLSVFSLDCTLLLRGPSA